MTLTIQSRDYWEAGVDSYVAIAEPFTALFCADAVALARIEPGMNFLDIATGPGAVALAAESAGAVVTAIDFSQGMIDELDKRAAGRRITALRMDGQSLDLPDAGFDRACSVFGVPLFPDWRAGLSEMARVLRPGGLAVVATAASPVGFGPNMVLAEARLSLFPGTPVSIGVDGMARLSDPERLRAALLDSGFADVEIHRRTHDFTFDASVFEQGRAMLEANPVLAGLNDTDRTEAIALARAMAEAQSSDGRVRRPCTALVAVARR